MKELSKLINRDKSCLTGKKITKSLWSVDNFPVYFGCVNTNFAEDLKTKMEFFIEEKTGLIQLNKLIPLEILYQNQHAFGVGEIWNKHYVNFAKFLSRGDHRNIIEIGGATERLANKYLSIVDANWTIIEPNPTEFKNKKINVIKGFFEDSSIDIKSSDTIVFSHVLEHAYDPALFMKLIYNKINNGQTVYLSYPRLEVWLDKKYTNALNFEHTVFLTEPHLDAMFEKIGFKLNNKEYFQDHSVFYKLTKSEPKIINFPNLYDRNITLFNSFIKHHQDDVKKLNNLMSVSKSHFYLFGAHIFSQFLIVLGLNTDKIKFVLDNSEEKQEKRLYGTQLMVKSPKILLEEKDPVVILKAANYNEEIKENILSKINANCKFL
tara:strand:+ start:7667 stop:8800 length:1134 start_codon:yes stop_codon:yes gene_type:complete